METVMETAMETVIETVMETRAVLRVETIKMVMVRVGTEANEKFLT